MLRLGKYFSSLPPSPCLFFLLKQPGTTQHRYSWVVSFSKAPWHPSHPSIWETKPPAREADRVSVAVETLAVPALTSSCHRPALPCRHVPTARLQPGHDVLLCNPLPERVKPGFLQLSASCGLVRWGLGRSRHWLTWLLGWREASWRPAWLGMALCHFPQLGASAGRCSPSCRWLPP